LSYFATGITYAGTRVPTDDLLHSAVATLFRHLRVKLRPAKREAATPKVDESPARLLTALSPFHGDYASLTAAAAVMDAIAVMEAIAVLPWG
jgi:hypothetical protein